MQIMTLNIVMSRLFIYINIFLLCLQQYNNDYDNTIKDKSIGFGYIIFITINIKIMFDEGNNDDINDKSNDYVYNYHKDS